MTRHYTTTGSPAQFASFDVDRADRVAVSIAKAASDALLRAQLRAGQHLLSITLARTLGASLGMHPDAVRPAAGDATIITTKGA